MAWKARLVARETTRLSPEAADYVDRHLAPVAHKIKPTQIDRLVNEAIGRFMPAEVERLAEASWDKRHVTVYDQLVSFTGTMTVAAELDIADALDLEAAVQAGAHQRAALGSTESLDVRRAQAIGDLARGQHASRPHREARQPVRHATAAEGAAASGRPLPPPLPRRPTRCRPDRDTGTR